MGRAHERLAYRLRPDADRLRRDSVGGRPSMRSSEPATWKWSTDDAEVVAHLGEHADFDNGHARPAPPVGSLLAVLLFRTSFFARRLLLCLLMILLFVPLPIIVSSWQGVRLGSRPVSGRVLYEHRGPALGDRHGGGDLGPRPGQRAVGRVHRRPRLDVDRAGTGRRSGPMRRPMAARRCW